MSQATPKPTEQPEEATQYRAASSFSKQLHERALKVMPGGNSRHSIALMPYPVYVRSGSGCRVIDEDFPISINHLSLVIGLTEVYK